MYGSYLNQLDLKDIKIIWGPLSLHAQMIIEYLLIQQFLFRCDFCGEIFNSEIEMEYHKVKFTFSSDSWIFVDFLWGKYDLVPQSIIFPLGRRKGAESYFPTPICKRGLIVHL